MPTMFDQHIDDYSVRVMSSMIGIMISTVVNIFVLPNNFMPELKKTPRSSFSRTQSATVFIRKRETSVCERKKPDETFEERPRVRTNGNVATKTMAASSS